MTGAIIHKKGCHVPHVHFHAHHAALLARRGHGGRDPLGFGGCLAVLIGLAIIGFMVWMGAR